MFGFFVSDVKHAQGQSSTQVTVRSEAESPTKTSTLSKRVGITYFSFFDGPGIDPDLRSFPPNQFGRPSDDGMNFFNII